jgi:two-component system LytT family response regulator
MILKCLIVDDEPEARFTTRTLIKTYGKNIEIIGEVSDLEAAKKFIKDKKPQLVFLDLQLVGAFGYDLFEEPVQRDYKVIITSAHTERAVDAFKYEVVDFLVKPFSGDQLVSAIDKVRKVLAPVESVKLISFQTKEGTLVMPSNQVIRLEAEGSYTLVHCSSGKPAFLISRNIGYMETLLENDGFIRVHNSHLISIPKILRFNVSAGCVEMVEGHLIPVSRDKKKRFLELYMGASY